MKEHFIIQLLHKHYTGVLDAKDKSLLDDWLQESPDNESYGDSIKEIWDLSANYAPKVDFESKTDSAFSKFAAAIQADKASANPATRESKTISIERANPKPKRNNTFRNIGWLSGMAACLVLMASTIWLLTQPADNHAIATLSTISDQTEKLLLADNSQVWVNEKSTISYDDAFEQGNRNVDLDGEAFFDVEKGKGTFSITTPNATVTVLGTAFNVDANENMTTVQVKEGVVELRPLNSTESIELTENQIGVYDAVQEKLYRKTSKSYNGDSWRTGGFSFEDATLEEVFTTLENFYDVDIYFENTDLKECVFTSPVYQDVELEEVLSVMEVIYSFESVKDEKQANRVIIKGGKCSK